MEGGGSRGRGRARACSGGAGRIRGRGRGRSARLLDFIEAGPSHERASSPSPTRPLPPQPTKSLTDQLRKARSAKVADKRNYSYYTKLSVGHKTTLMAELRAKKQVGRYLLPDAPPSKRNKRKKSPIRVPCPLLPGVPATPPPRKVQAWEKRSIPGSVAQLSEEEEATQPLVPFPTTFIEIEMHPDAQIVDGEIQFIDFTPSSNLDQGSITDKCTTPAYLEPHSFDDEDDVLALPNDVGSDGEEPQPDNDNENAATVGQQCSMGTAEENLPSNLAVLLEEMGTRDDSALREEAASSHPDLLHFEWTNDPETFQGQQESFTGDAGPTFTVDGLSPFDIFMRIWDTDILYMIVVETNRYGRQLYATANKSWTDIDCADVWIFLTLIMLQGILILPVEREYWYPCLDILKVGNFHKIMPYKKFKMLKKCLHFVDNDTLQTTAGEDRKIKKIWPIIQHLNNKFSTLYLPEQYIAIDESLLLWKGRLSFVQLIATKAARVGIKSYELCESRTGYLWKMLLYTGNGDKSQPAYETAATNDEPEGTISKIVHNLVRPLLHKGHTLVMDNFYNSPLLSRTLKGKKTDTMGTLRLKREFVPDSLRSINKSNLRQGEVIFSQTADLTITVWHDSNIVALISTYHKSLVGGKEKYGTYKYKPQVVLDYNMTMGGVDKKDQMLQAFPVERLRNLVWYKKLYRRLLNVSIYNAFVIYNHGKNGNQRQFRVALVKEILHKFRVPEPGRQIRQESHFPTKAATRRSRCKMCSLKKMQTRTVYKCEGCDVPLCILGCFKEYHLK